MYIVQSGVHVQSGHCRASTMYHEAMQYAPTCTCTYAYVCAGCLTCRLYLSIMHICTCIHCIVLHGNLHNILKTVTKTMQLIAESDRAEVMQRTLSVHYKKK